MNKIISMLFVPIILCLAVNSADAQITTRGGVGTPGSNVSIPVFLDSGGYIRQVNLTVAYDSGRFSLIDVLSYQPNYLPSYITAPGAGEIQISFGSSSEALSMMPPFGPALGSEGALDVANFVRSLSGLSHDVDRATRGKNLFSANCVACHDADAKGSRPLMAPDLTDSKWLSGGNVEQIYEVIANGRYGVLENISGPLLKLILAIRDPYPALDSEESIVDISGYAIDEIGASVVLSPASAIVSVFPTTIGHTVSEGNTLSFALLAISALLYVFKIRSRHDARSLKKI